MPCRCHYRRISGGEQGAGYLIIYGSQVFKMDMVVMSIVILCIVSAVLYQGITFLEKRMKR